MSGAVYKLSLEQLYANIRFYIFINKIHSFCYIHEEIEYTSC